MLPARRRRRRGKQRSGLRSVRSSHRNDGEKKKHLEGRERRETQAVLLLAADAANVKGTSPAGSRGCYALEAFEVCAVADSNLVCFKFSPEVEICSVRTWWCLWYLVDMALPRPPKYYLAYTDEGGCGWSPLCCL